MLFDAVHPSQQVPNKSATTAPTRTDVYLYQETDGESDETYTHDGTDSRLRHVEVRHNHVEATKGEPFYYMPTWFLVAL